MDHSRLPIEICERIIDFSNNKKYKYWVHNKVLRRCALTCHSWMPRSYYNLYSRIWVGDPGRLALFVRTMETKPWLGRLVKEMRLWEPPAQGGGASYLPIVHGALLSSLRQLESLTLLGLQWHGYPAEYRNLVGIYPIADLKLWGSDFRTISDLLHFVWSFRTLRSLSLYSTVNESEKPRELSEVDFLLLSCRKGHWVRTKIEHLHLGGIYTSLKTFPPRGAFGFLLTKLELELTAGGPEVSEALLDYIPHLPRLDTVETCMNEVRHLEDLKSLSDLLVSILSRVNPDSSSLHTILIHLRLRVLLDDALASRARAQEVFDVLFGDALKAGLERHSALKTVRLHIWGNNSVAKLPQATWWVARLSKWMPHLRHVFEVQSDAPDSPEDSDYATSSDESSDSDAGSCINADTGSIDVDDDC